MNNINSYLLLLILFISCSNEKNITIQKDSINVEPTLIYNIKDTLSESSIKKNDVIESQNIDSNLGLPDYIDFQSENIIYLKHNIGKAYSIETYQRLFDSNKTELYKLIRAYNQNQNINPETNNKKSN